MSAKSEFIIDPLLLPAAYTSAIMQFIPFLATLFFTSVLAAPKPVPQTYTECELVLTDYPVNTCPLQPANGGIGDYCDAIGKSYGGWSWGDGEVSY